MRCQQSRDAQGTQPMGPRGGWALIFSWIWPQVAAENGEKKQSERECHEPFQPLNIESYHRHFLWQHLNNNLHLWKQDLQTECHCIPCFLLVPLPGRQQTMTRPQMVAGKRKELSNSGHFAAFNFSIGAKILQFTRCFFWWFLWWSLLVKIGYTQYIHVIRHI